MRKYLVVLAVVSVAMADNVEWHIEAESKLEAYKIAKNELSKHKKEGIYQGIILVEEMA